MASSPLLPVSQTLTSPLSIVHFDGNRRRKKDRNEGAPPPIIHLTNIPTRDEWAALEGVVSVTDAVSMSFANAFMGGIRKIPKKILDAFRENDWQIVGCDNYHEEALPYMSHSPGSQGVTNDIGRYIFIREKIDDFPNKRAMLLTADAKRQLEEDILHETGHAVDRLSAQKPLRQVLPQTGFVARVVATVAGVGVGIANTLELLPMGSVGNILTLLWTLFSTKSCVDYLGFYQSNFNTTSSERPFKEAFKADIQRLLKRSTKQLRRDLPKLAYYLQDRQEAFAESFYASLEPKTPKGRFILNQLPHCVAFVQQHILPRYQ